MRIGGRRAEDVTWVVEWKLKEGRGRRKEKEGEKKIEKKGARSKSLGVGRMTRSRIRS